MSHSFSIIADNGAIEKPALEDRAYRHIKLANSLNVLVISDPSADKSAAALDVNVGSFGDKRFNVPGLAHFCEHLLFMGTKKFPEENAYLQYLSKHAGSSNAYTASEHTNYYFEVGSDHLEGALDRFSQFFISPLFSKSCQDREIRAVDSENKKNLQNDSWRFYQLDKALSNPQHPFNGFSTGNLYTLGQEPALRGVNVRDVLIDFYNNTYSANVMGLVILGKEPLDVLTEWATTYFSDIPNHDLPRPSYDGEPLYTAKQLGKLVKAKSIKDAHTLEVNFIVPDDQKANWQSKPASYFSHLVGHEGKGSLFHFLKLKNWVSELSAGGHTMCVGLSIFYVDLDLTQQGLDHWDEVLVHVFEYIQMVKAQEPLEQIWSECSDMSKIDFKFTQKGGAASTVSRLSTKLHDVMEDGHIPPEYLLSSRILREFDADKIKQYGHYLSKDNIRVSLRSQNMSGLTEKERWYGTEYSEEDLPGDLVDKILSAGANPELYLPKKNDFIPEDFTVVGQKAEKPLRHPWLIEESASTQVWFKQDDQFLVPKGEISLRLHVPKIAATIESQVAAQLFIELLDDELNDVLYYASLVGLHFKISFVSANVISLELSGYNHKLHVLLEYILKALTTFTPREERFAPVKEKLRKDWANFGFRPPFHQVGSITTNLISHKSFPQADKAAVVANDRVTYDDVVALSNNIFADGLYTFALVHGNFTYEDASKIALVARSYFKKFPPVVDDAKKAPEVVRLSNYIIPAGQHVRYETSLKDPKEVNSCIEYYILLDTDFRASRLRLLMDLFSTIVHEPGFNQLRTREQLGYVVFTGTRATREKGGFHVLIQSERDCEYLEFRIEEFLKRTKKQLDDMTDDNFAEFKKALRDKKLLKHKNLREEFASFRNHINAGDLGFDTRFKHAELLDLVTKEEIVQFYHDFIDPTNNQSKSARVTTYLRSQSVPEVTPQKALSSALVNAVLKFDLDVESDKLDAIIENNEVADIVEEIAKLTSLGPETKEQFLEDVQRHLDRPTPAVYPRGRLTSLDELHHAPLWPVLGSLYPPLDFHYSATHL